MVLACSAGHRFGTKDIGVRVSFGDTALRVGGRCPMVLSYSRMQGTTYCRRVLREASEPMKKTTTKLVKIVFIARAGAKLRLPEGVVTKPVKISFLTKKRISRR